MRKILLLLGKDSRLLARSPVLTGALIAYPLLIALLVGLVVRYAGERPRVALVGESGLPGVLVVGEHSFDVRGMLEQAKEVQFVSMPAAQAQHELETGRVLASLVIPEGFASKLRGLRESPHIVLKTTQGGLSTRVVEKVRALVYDVNLQLQKAYIQANLAAVDLLLRGGSGTIGQTRFTLLGLDRAERELRRLTGSRDPDVAARARELLQFVRQLRGAVGQVGEFLRATANPIQLETAAKTGRTWLLSAQVQAYSLALALAFVTVLLGAAAVTSERDEHVLGRLARGLVGLGQLLVEKTMLAAAVAVSVGLALALGFGLVVELAGVSGGEPWSRLPLLAVGLVLAGAAYGAFGVLLGTLARELGVAALLAFLVALPLTLIAAVPHESLSAAAPLADLFPFGHSVSLFTSALYDPRPAATVSAQTAWLAGLAAAFLGAARLSVRRLLV
jgi:ABC-2 type transport system permease protein